MPGIVGTLNNYNAPNYVGELIRLTPENTPILSAMGGLQEGGRQTTSLDIQWQTEELRDPDQRTALEGADAPTASGDGRANLTNITEIHHESVGVTYSKQAAIGQFAGANIAGTNPVTDEYTRQVNNKLLVIKRDAEFSFLNGVYSRPETDIDRRKTRGLIAAARLGVAGKANVLNRGAEALTAVAVTASDKKFTKASHGLENGDPIKITGGLAGGFNERRVYYVVNKAAGNFEVSAIKAGPALTPTVDVASVSVVKLATDTKGDHLLNAVQLAWTNGGFNPETTALICGADAARWVTREFITKKNYREESRSVGGVACTTILTEFGKLNVMLSTIAPHSLITTADLGQCEPAWLVHPEYGALFVQKLATKGSKDEAQLYGEFGLHYGNPLSHGVFEGTSFADVA